MSERPTPRLSTRTKIAAVGAATALGLIGGAVWAVLSPGEASATEVRLEPTSFAGPNPFMPPVGQDQLDVTPPAGTAGEFAGDTPGLFAEDADKPSCDSPSLIGNLQGDEAKARAWAEALGLNFEDISSYVGTLTPVVLRSDTAVTNHDYENGTFVAIPTVLQAGTAVFINSFGEPKVKCFSGNPLTKGESVPEARYEGPSWRSFAPTTVTIIYRPQIVINSYTFINVREGDTIYREAKPPAYDDDNWFCKRNADSAKCSRTGSGSTTTTTRTTTTTTTAAKPDPALADAAAKAQKIADEADKAAKEARARADDKAIEARIFDGEARRLEDEAARLAAAAAADPTNAAKKAEADAAAARAKVARQEAQEKANQFKYADVFARNAENNKKLADEQAKQAKKAADMAAGNGTPVPDNSKSAPENSTSAPENSKSVPENGTPLTDTERAALCRGVVGPGTDPRCELPQSPDPRPVQEPVEQPVPAPDPNPASATVPGSGGVPAPVVPGAGGGETPSGASTGAITGGGETPSGGAGTGAITGGAVSGGEAGGGGEGGAGEDTGGQGGSDVGGGRDGATEGGGDESAGN